MTTSVKAFDTKNTYAINTTGTVVLINAIPSGATASSQLAGHIRMYKCEFIGRVVSSTFVNNNPDTLRILIVYDKQANNAAPALSDVLLDTTAATVDVNSHVNLGNLDRFEILYDRSIPLPGVLMTTVSGTGPQTASAFCIRDTLKLNHATHFNNAAGVLSGALRVFTLGTFAAGSESWELIATARVYFSDY